MENKTATSPNNYYPASAGYFLVVVSFFCTPKFQSTPSAWRETKRPHRFDRLRKISIHSLRVEGDRVRCLPMSPRPGFQSTPSAWRETPSLALTWYGDYISIHSLRVEGDVDCQKNSSLLPNFNPLPPRGGRLSSCFVNTFTDTFQSTPSAWRETTFGSSGA